MLRKHQRKNTSIRVANFLRYGNNLKVVRALSTGMLNATTGTTRTSC